MKLLFVAAIVVSSFACSVAQNSYTYTEFLIPGATITDVLAINNNGAMVGIYGKDYVVRAFAEKDHKFRAVAFPGAKKTWAQGINEHGQVVGSYGEEEDQGFLLSDGVYTTIQYPAFGINGRGDVVGYYYDGISSHGFLYSGGEYTTIDYPEGSATILTGINNQGVIVGTWGFSPQEGFTYRDGTFKDLTYPGSAVTIPTGINNLGQIVGFYADQAHVTHGFLLSHGTFSTIDYPGALQTTVNGVNDKGMIVGFYTGGPCQIKGGGCGFVATPTGTLTSNKNFVVR